MSALYQIRGGARSASAAEATTPDLKDGLVAYYPFDDSLDNIVSGGQAKLHGGAGTTWAKDVTGEAVTYGTGKKGKAFEFNGGEVSADGNNGLELDVNTGESFTISAWVNTAEKIDYQAIFFTNVDGDNYVTAGTNYNSFASGGIVNYKTIWAWLDKNNNCSSSLQDLQIDTWTHIVLTFDDRKKAVLYYNAEVLSYQNIMENFPDFEAGAFNNMPIFLGVNWWNPSFKGLMDDVAVYNRALSADEVTALYNEENANVDGLELNITAEGDKTILTNKKYSEDNISVDSVQLSATIDSQSLPMQCTWKVNESAHATIDDTGMLKLTEDATDGEKITVTATNSYGVTGTIELTVEVVESVLVEVEGIKLNMETATIDVGDTLELIATILPEDASDKDVVWTSDNASVATVNDSGVVTAVAKGTTKITVTSKANADIIASCVVTVTEKNDSNDDETVYTITVSDEAKKAAEDKHTKVSLSDTKANNKGGVELTIVPEEGYLIKSAIATTERNTCKISSDEKGANGAWIIKLSDFTDNTIVNSITVETEEASVFENTDTSQNTNGASLGGTDFADESVANAITTAITNKESIDAIIDKDGNELPDNEVDEVIKAIDEAVNDGSSKVVVSLEVQKTTLDSETEDTANKLLDTDVKQEAEKAAAGSEIKDMKIAMPLDIALFASMSIKSSTDESQDKDIKIRLKDTGAKKMTIKMSVESVEKEADNITRLYYVIHFHGEKQEIIPCKYDKAGKTITFESNSFSPYVLCYVDTAKMSSNSGNGGLATYPVTVVTPSPTATSMPTATPITSATPAPISTSAPTATPSITPDPTSEPQVTPDPTSAPGTEPTATPDNIGDKNNGNDDDSLSVGDKVTVNNLKYEVTSTDDTKTVVFIGIKKSKAKVVIPATIKISGDTYKVKGIAKNAFKGDKKLKELTIGKNVRLIGNNAFNNCKKLEKIVIKTKKLTDEKVDSKAFSGVGAKVTITLPKSKAKAYKKLIKAKGAKNVKFKNA